MKQILVASVLVLNSIVSMTAALAAPQSYKEGQ